MTTLVGLVPGERGLAAVHLGALLARSFGERPRGGVRRADALATEPVPPGRRVPRPPGDDRRGGARAGRRRHRAGPVRRVRRPPGPLGVLGAAGAHLRRPARTGCRWDRPRPGPRAGVPGQHRGPGAARLRRVPQRGARRVHRGPTAGSSGSRSASAGADGDGDPAGGHRLGGAASQGGPADRLLRGPTDDLARRQHRGGRRGPGRGRVGPAPRERDLEGDDDERSRRHRTAGRERRGPGHLLDRGPGRRRLGAERRAGRRRQHARRSAGSCSARTPARSCAAHRSRCSSCPARTPSRSPHLSSGRGSPPRRPRRRPRWRAGAPPHGPCPPRRRPACSAGCARPASCPRR